MLVYRQTGWCSGLSLSAVGVVATGPDTDHGFVDAEAVEVVEHDRHDRRCPRDRGDVLNMYCAGKRKPCLSSRRCGARNL
jgi:hypothetical protein